MNLRKPALLAAALLSIGSLGLWFLHDPEPFCDGLMLRRWLDANYSVFLPNQAQVQTFVQIPGKEGDLLRRLEADLLHRRHRAKNRIQTFGEPETRSLAKIITQTETAFHRRYRQWYGSALRFPALGSFLPVPADYDNRRISALSILILMGPRGAGAFPTIVQATRDPIPNIRLHSLDALFAVSRNSTLEFKCLNHLVAATDDHDFQVRKTAYQHLRHFTNHPNEVIPVFVKGLHDDRTLHTCFSVVKNFGSAAAPALVEAMKKESGHVRPAEALLEQIDPDLVQKIKTARLVAP